MIYIYGSEAIKFWFPDYPVKVKDFDLDTNYFAKREDGEKFEKKERTSN